MFLPRQKGQRYDKNLLPLICVPNEVNERELYDYSDAVQGPLVGTFAIIGTSKNGFGQPTELLCVTLLDGTKVPATRLAVDGHNWNVCQTYSLKAIKP